MICDRVIDRPSASSNWHLAGAVLLFENTISVSDPERHQSDSYNVSRAAEVHMAVAVARAGIGRADAHHGRVERDA